MTQDKEDQIREEAVIRLVKRYYLEYTALIDDLEIEWNKYGGILK